MAAAILPTPDFSTLLYKASIALLKLGDRTDYISGGLMTPSMVPA
jgi:hypothetical protein